MMIFMILFLQAFAVDGIKSSWMGDNSCINADRWWICDMQDFHFVSKAVVYMRDEFCKFVKLCKIITIKSFFMEFL